MYNGDAYLVIASTIVKSLVDEEVNQEAQHIEEAGNVLEKRRWYIV